MFTDRAPQQAEATCALDGCKKTFNYIKVGPEQRYCSQKCRAEAGRLRARRHYLKSKGYDDIKVDDLMRHFHKRSSTSVPEGYDRKKAEKPEERKRRCTHTAADNRCITVLCRYNPGPLCFHHAEQVAGQLEAEYQRQRRDEIARTQAMMRRHNLEHIEAAETERSLQLRERQRQMRQQREHRANQQSVAA